MPRNIKIIATISSLNCSVEFIRSLYEKGMTVVRLNTAHMMPEEALNIIANTRSVSDRIGILLDTKGPEMRTCPADESLSVTHGEVIKMKGAPGQKSIGDLICVSYSGFVHDVPIGSSVLVDDGYIALTVIDKNDEFLFAGWRMTELSDRGRVSIYHLSTSNSLHFLKRIKVLFDLLRKMILISLLTLSYVMHRM